MTKFKGSAKLLVCDQFAKTLLGTSKICSVVHAFQYLRGGQRFPAIAGTISKMSFKSRNEMEKVIVRSVVHTINYLRCMQEMFRFLSSVALEEVVQLNNN